MTSALLLQHITLAGGSYAPILLTALALTPAADACLLPVAIHATRTWRIAAALTMLPTLYILHDFLRRASHTF
jgi:hypothetical protein